MLIEELFSFLTGYFVHLVLLKMTLVNNELFKNFAQRENLFLVAWYIVVFCADIILTGIFYLSMMNFHTGEVFYYNK